MEGVQSSYNQTDAGGFIRLNSLRLRARHAAQQGDAGAKPKKAKRK
jgi:argininosuccinate synthase